MYAALSKHVIALAVHFFDKITSINELWIQTGSVGKVVDKCSFHFRSMTFAWRSDLLLFSILPAVHAITGCDSVSSLFSIGKRTVKTVSGENGEKFKDLSCMAC